MSEHEEESSLPELENELTAVSKQIGKVEMNAVAVEDAIAGHGTYRGYSGEDVFLRHNLRVVQREMIKQLRRKERDLKSRKRQLVCRMEARSSGPSSSPGEPTISPEVVGGREGGDKGSSRTVDAALDAQGVVATPSASISAGTVVAGSSVSGGGAVSRSPERPQVAESPAEPPRPTNPEPLPVHAEPSPRATSPTVVVSVALPSLDKPAVMTSVISAASTGIPQARAESTEPVKLLGVIPSALAVDSTGKTAEEQTPSGEPPEQQSVEPHHAVDVKWGGHPPQKEAADPEKQGTSQPQAVTPQPAPTTSQPQTVEEQQIVEPREPREPREPQASEPHEESSGCQERAVESQPQSDDLQREPVAPEKQPAQSQQPAQPQQPVPPPQQPVPPQQRTAQEGPADPEQQPVESQQQVVASQQVTDQQRKPVEKSQQPQRLVAQERPAVDQEKKQAVGPQKQAVESQPPNVGPQRERRDEGQRQLLNQPPVGDSESVDQQQRPLESPPKDVVSLQQDPGEQDRSLPEASVGEQHQQQQIVESLPPQLPPQEAAQQEQEAVRQPQKQGNPPREHDSPRQQPVEPEQQTPPQQRSGGDKQPPSGSRQQSDESGVQGAAAAASDTSVQKQTPSKRPATTTPANQSPSKRPSPPTKSQQKASKQDAADSAATGRRSSKSPASEPKNPRSSRKSVGENIGEVPAGRKSYSRRSFAASPRVFKTPKRGSRDVPGPAHSVEEYLAGTQRGKEAVASIKEGTVFWIKFSDTKVAWLECGVIKKVHGRSAKPYEVEWRPYDCSGCEIAGNPQKRISLTPRLFVGYIESQERLKSGGPPAGTESQACPALAEKNFPLNVPPIGSWCLADRDQPWGALGPFAF